MSLHKEVRFEDEICEHLAAHGWLYEPGHGAAFARERALYPADVRAFLEATQPDAWAALTQRHGDAAEEQVLARLRAQLDQRGTLDVLRHGIELIGLRQPLRLAQFRPATGLNPEIVRRYEANRLRVVRQVRYARDSENAIDLVLFLNGVPVATAELKSDFTQSVEDAVDQYRATRLPKTKAHVPEPLLAFPGGALVHFAVSHHHVRMTTRLDGADTAFLPFDRGDDGGAGNPLNPEGGHRTAYLWEYVWARESWLELLGRYLVARRDDKGQLSRVIFPRYHQLDVTRKLQAAVLADGPGGRYLVQHSAGSGKTNSIAWTAHFLADLHDAEDRKLFDSVLVVSDRNVIDGQLRDAVDGFQRTVGVVATIKGERGSKSGELAEALAQGKKIVVCTIQTFPFALDEVQRLAATEGKRFAVIADEAHSSQAGDTSAKLRAVLSAAELAELSDGGEIGTEDILAAQMTARAEEGGITFVAFTATPKNKTLELFGTRPDPSRKPAKDNVPRPFHVYSMRQAIEEGFILDVLRNYTPYSLAFKLAHEGKELDERQVERSAALKRVMGWVKLHPYNIAQKVEIVVEHYREHVAPLLGGRAKAMVVVASRREAVRWQLAMQRFIRERGYAIGTLVAFSGEVTDAESGPEPFTEHSPLLNPRLGKKDIRKAFEGADYHVLLVANKYQTGFDQPLLSGMYVDKRLAGIQAVQTLSRLNRAHPGKQTTFVVDFVNDPEEVLAAFKTYYATAELAGTTNPDLVFDLKAKLDATGHYDDADVEAVVRVELDPQAKQRDLERAIEPVADRIVKRYAAARLEHWTATQREDDAAAKRAKDVMDALTLFKRDLGAYVRLYTFLSQIFDYGSTSVEKRAIFFRRLEPLLELGRERETIDLSKLKLTHHTLRDRGARALPLGAGDKLEPLSAPGTGAVQEPEKARLAEIIEKVNTLFEGELTDGDKLVYVNDVLLGKLLESETLAKQAASNTKEQFAASPDLNAEILNAIMEALDAHTAMSTQALGSERIRVGLRDILLNHAGLWESLRAREAP
ncbi:MAG: type I restriction endonuclease subunit R [Sandaracinaceae bacterium]|nr:type I restriction endonuclease subunit R [Sandaracinaceae bacterium]